MSKKKSVEFGELPELPKALKDWRIVQNNIDIIIRTGDPVEVPPEFYQALETEGVIPAGSNKKRR